MKQTQLIILAVVTTLMVITTSAILAVMALSKRDRTTPLEMATATSLEQADSGLPTPAETPDFAGFATSFCCGEKSPTYVAPLITPIAGYTFPSIAQQEQWAVEAQTAYPIPSTRSAHWTTTAQSVIWTATTTALTPPPPGFLPPSGEWTRYTHPVYGYSFEYPANWSIEIDTHNDTIYIFNINPQVIVAKDASGLTPLKIGFYASNDLGGYSSLEAYVNDKQAINPPTELISHFAETLPNGYQIVWRKVKTVMSFDGVLYVWIAYKGKAFSFYASDLRSKYIDVADHVVDSFEIP